jgi:hypothetical protein
MITTEPFESALSLASVSSVERTMSNQLVEGLFLLALWAPPLAVLAGALMVVAPRLSAQPASLPAHGAPLTH